MEAENEKKCRPSGQSYSSERDCPVYIYKERFYNDEEGVRQHELTLLEKVMDWQCSNNPADDGYFDAHPDVKRSKYISNNVVKTLNCFEESLHERIDAVAIVIDVEEK